MKRITCLLMGALAVIVLTGCLSSETKKTVILHNELYQGYAQDIRANRTTPETDRQFILKNAEAMQSLTKLLIGAPKKTEPQG